MPKRDVSFEMLAEVCGIDWQHLTGSSRGMLNRALGEIRTLLPELEDEELALVIEGKARSYRKVMGDAMLTPTALAKHWPQLDSLVAEQEKPQTFVSSDLSDCTTCGGLRWVLVGYRPVQISIWALEHRTKRNPHMGEPRPEHSGPLDGFEEWAPCRDCNYAAVPYVEDYLDRFTRVHGRRPKPPTQAALDAMKQALGAPPG